MSHPASAPSCKMPWSDYEKKRQIGAGSFGRAYLVQVLNPTARMPADKKLLVMKEIDMSKMDARERQNAAVEVQVLSSLKHPYIVRYWESFMHDHQLCIMMDYCDGGDLWQCISQCRRNRTQLKEAQVSRWFTQMCLALKYMHEKNVLHRDIKTQNVFLAKRESGGLGCVKIADFGIAKVLESHNSFARTMVGTPYYLSPEICKKEPYACPSDVWAVGCVLFELCALRVPFEAQELAQLVQKIVSAPLPRIPSMYSRELSDIAADLLAREANRRPCAAAILQRPLLQAEIKKMLAENHGRDSASARGSGSEEMMDQRGSDRDRGSARGNSKDPRPLGDHNPRTPQNRRASSKPSSRAPSPHKEAAKQMMQQQRPSRAPSPARAHSAPRRR